jgi:hypothetical protein
MKPRGKTEQPICPCGRAQCRPHQRTCRQCHADEMRAARLHACARPPWERMKLIWTLVRSGAFPNATLIAKKLETSTRSIHRDIEFMRERLGFDIRYDGSRFGYYTPPGPHCCPFCEPVKL